MSEDVTFQVNADTSLAARGLRALKEVGNEVGQSIDAAFQTKIFGNGNQANAKAIKLKVEINKSELKDLESQIANTKSKGLDPTVEQMRRVNQLKTALIDLESTGEQSGTGIAGKMTALAAVVKGVSWVVGGLADMFKEAANRAEAVAASTRAVAEAARAAGVATKDRTVRAGKRTDDQKQATVDFEREKKLLAELQAQYSKAVPAPDWLANSIPFIRAHAKELRAGIDAQVKALSDAEIRLHQADSAAKEGKQGDVLGRQAFTASQGTAEAKTKGPAAELAEAKRQAMELQQIISHLKPGDEKEELVSRYTAAKAKLVELQDAEIDFAHTKAALDNSLTSNGTKMAQIQKEIAALEASTAASGAETATQRSRMLSLRSEELNLAKEARDIDREHFEFSQQFMSLAEKKAAVDARAAAIKIKVGVTTDDAQADLKALENQSQSISAQQKEAAQRKSVIDQAELARADKLLQVRAKIALLTAPSVPQTKEVQAKVVELRKTEAATVQQGTTLGSQKVDTEKQLLSLAEQRASVDARVAAIKVKIDVGTAGNAKAELDELQSQSEALAAKEKEAAQARDTIAQAELVRSEKLLQVRAKIASLTAPGVVQTTEVQEKVQVLKKVESDTVQSGGSLQSDKLDAEKQLLSLAQKRADIDGKIHSVKIKIETIGGNDELRRELQSLQSQARDYQDQQRNFAHEQQELDNTEASNKKKLLAVQQEIAQLDKDTAGRSRTVSEEQTRMSRLSEELALKKAIRNEGRADFAFSLETMNVIQRRNAEYARAVELKKDMDKNGGGNEEQKSEYRSLLSSVRETTKKAVSNRPSPVVTSLRSVGLDGTDRVYRQAADPLVTLARQQNGTLKRMEIALEKMAAAAGQPNLFVSTQ